LITALSARNPKVQRLRRLSAKRADRAAEGAFVVEGWKLVEEAIAAGVPLEAVFVDPDGAARVDVGSVPVHVVEASVLAGALDTRTPQGIAAIARAPLTHLDAVDANAGPVLVLVGVGDPGNAGTLVRTAEAAGCSAVLFSNGSVDAYAPKCVRASAGSIFRVPVVNEGEGVQVLERLADHGVRRLGTSAHDGVPYDRTDLNAPFALVLGSEAHGLPIEIADRLDGRVHIPMAAPVESLNVGVAGSVVLFEAARQRRASGRGR
jgi:TrmH family RNA methyltransferase